MSRVGEARRGGGLRRPELPVLPHRGPVEGSQCKEPRAKGGEPGAALWDPGFVQVGTVLARVGVVQTVQERFGFCIPLSAAWLKSFPHLNVLRASQNCTSMLASQPFSGTCQPSPKLSVFCFLGIGCWLGQ